MRRGALILPVWVRTLLLHLANLVWVAFVLAPVLWMFVTSLLPMRLLLKRPPVLDLSRATFDGYLVVLADSGFHSAFLNSLIVAIGTAGISVIGGALGAYAIARYRFPGKRAVLLLILMTQMVPGVVMLIPSFILLRSLGLMDTYSGLILIHVAFLSPIVMWLLHGFFRDIPASLERAARVDGCSRIQALRFVIAPLAVNGVASAALFCFIDTWASFIFPLVLTISKTLTLPIVISRFRVLYRLNFGEGATYAILTALPVILLTLIGQRFIVKGIVEGGVKT